MGRRSKARNPYTAIYDRQLRARADVPRVVRRFARESVFAPDKERPPDFFVYSDLGTMRALLRTPSLLAARRELDIVLDDDMRSTRWLASTEDVDAAAKVLGGLLSLHRAIAKPVAAVLHNVLELQHLLKPGVTLESFIANLVLIARQWAARFDAEPPAPALLAEFQADLARHLKNSAEVELLARSKLYASTNQASATRSTTSRPFSSITLNA